MKNTLTLFMLLVGMRLLAQSDSVALKKHFTILPEPKQAGFSISPDYATIRMSNIGSRWHNMMGGSIPMLQYEYKGHTISVGTSGYIELHDISESQLMSWQLWRGNLGFDFYLHPRLRNKQHNLRLGYIMHHESQHVTDMNTFAYEYLKNPGAFDNASARSFEYDGFEVKHEYTTKKPVIKFYNRALLRRFSKPVLEGAHRQQTGAFAFESGIKARLSKEDGVWLYAQGYYEEVQNDFVAKESPYKGSWNKQPFKYLMGEIGIWLVPEGNGRSFNFYLTWGKFNGRGLDFTTVYKGPGAGFRFNL